MRRFVVVLAASLLVAAPAFAQEQPPQPDSDTLDPLRDRFRAGMDEYKKGKYGDAILVWLDIYRELGPEKGYRLAFNLGRAYDQTLNEQKALEFYEAYLAAVASRRAAGEAMEPIVEKQEAEANDRLVEPRAKYGRLHIADASVQVRIDAALPREGGYVAYVQPGKHVVVFRPGTTDESRADVDVTAGRLVDLAPPPVKPPEPTVIVEPPRYELRRAPPYPKAVVYIGAGVTALSFIAPLALYVRAGAKLDLARGTARDASQSETNHSNAVGAQNAASDAQFAAYASWAVPAVVGVATLALAAYYILGTKNVRTPVQTAIAF